jgi:hypothetical protein
MPMPLQQIPFSGKYHILSAGLLVIIMNKKNTD